MATEKANALLAKYKPGIRPGKKSVLELQAWLEARYDVEPMPLREFSEAFRRGCLYCSAARAITNWKLQLPQSAFDFAAYRVLETEKNRRLGLQCGDSFDYLYVVMERKTGFLSSNSAKLFDEMTVAQGVTQADYDADSYALLHYVTCLDCLEKGEY